MQIEEETRMSAEFDIERRRNELIAKIVARCATTEEYNEYHDLTRKMSAMMQSPRSQRYKTFKDRLSRFRLAV